MGKILLSLVSYLDRSIAVVALLSIGHKGLDLRVVQVNFLATVATHIGCNSLIREVHLSQLLLLLLLLLILLETLLVLHLLEIILQVLEVEVPEFLRCKVLQLVDILHDLLLKAFAFLVFNGHAAVVLCSA